MGTYSHVWHYIEFLSGTEKHMLKQSEGGVWGKKGMLVKIQKFNKKYLSFLICS